jgi:hypothetical protein
MNFICYWHILHLHLLLFFLSRCLWFVSIQISRLRFHWFINQSSSRWKINVDFSRNWSCRFFESFSPSFILEHTINGPSMSPQIRRFHGCHFCIIIGRKLVGKEVRRPLGTWYPYQVSWKPLNRIRSYLVSDILTSWYHKPVKGKVVPVLI